MIDIKEKVVLGGLPQKIHIRGAEESLPVLLCLHGGPGVTNRHSIMQCRKLTDSFLTVAWDQRGTAGSYWGAKAKDLTIAQMVSDANELVEYLRKKFRREKILLMGGSWGSLLGICLLKEHPEHISAFIGFGQVVNIEKNEQICWQFCVDAAKKAGNQKDMDTLLQVGPPVMGCYKDGFDGMMKQRNLLMKYGGYSKEAGKQSYWDAMVKPIMKSREYSLPDLIGYILGYKFVLRNMWEEVGRTDFPKTHTQFEAPIFIFDGRLDYNTPSELVEDWFDRIEAPVKELHWFEHSGHNPMSDEPDKFFSLLKETEEKLKPASEELGKRTETGTGRAGKKSREPAANQINIC